MSNRLAFETSPYLRQHAENPVDWYPWGEEALAESRLTGKPILLSVGYSACHWCHVMAHESFEDPSTAAVMNELFVNIKVDREERPDIDAIYMEAVQAMTSRGGWPMTVFLAPDTRPFYGGTYFAREQFVALMRAVDDAWHNKHDELLEQASQLTEAVGRMAQLPAGDSLPGHDVVERAVQALFDQFDPEWGGFGGAPKFPQTMSLEVVLQAWTKTGRAALKRMLTVSLDAMASGGMYDHLGGGFARYSVDRQWLAPHFEKMLYDQALLARIYLHAWLATGESRYRQVVEETIDYVLLELQDPLGGWYSAEDADSEGEEGKFYVWSPAEAMAVLGLDAGSGACDWYEITPGGNFEGHSIPCRLHHRGLIERPAEIERARLVLLAHRNTRVRPGLDDKVLTEWNALFLSTLSQAAASFDRSDWLAAAIRNGEFMLNNLTRGDGRWLRSWQAHPAPLAKHLAYAADYAALVDAFTRLYEATGETRWITHATITADSMVELFWDPVAGGLFTTGDDAEALITRPKDLLDNAIPSANSVAALAFYRLSALTGRTSYRELADQIIMLSGEMAAKHPTAFAHLLAAIELRAVGVTEIVIPGAQNDLLRETRRHYLPHAVVAWGEHTRPASPVDPSLFAGRVAGTAYVCRDRVCQLPTDTVEVLREQLSCPKAES